MARIPSSTSGRCTAEYIDAVDAKLRELIAALETELSEADRQIIRAEKREYAEAKKAQHWERMQECECDCGSGDCGSECCYADEEDEEDVDG